MRSEPEFPEDALPADFVDGFIDRGEASAYLASIGVKRTRETLASIACTGSNGPPFVRVDGRPLYSKRALHIWGVRQLSAVRASPRKLERERGRR